MNKTKAPTNYFEVSILIVSLAAISFFWAAFAPLSTRSAGAPEPEDIRRVDQLHFSDPMQKVEQGVLDDLTMDGEATFFVLLRAKPNLAPAATFAKRAGRTTFVYENLTSVAETSQADLRKLLDSRGVTYQPFWIINAIQVTGDESLLQELAGRPEVEKVVAHRIHKLPESEPVVLAQDVVPQGVTALGVGTVEWGINNIQAPLVWSTFGVRGEGIVVANIDTGVQFNHPALAAQYRGNQNGVIDHNYNWRDPSGVCSGPVPCDNNGNGTQTMGIMVGDDGASNQIGVAPAARWMACKGCATNSCSDAALLACGQWIVAPTDLSGGNPRPDLAPHIVNNSWAGPGGDAWFQTVVNNWVAAGIFPAFANANGGPACSTSGSPADYVNSYSAGAYDINNNIASSSGRGPSPFGGEIKPNLAAPGVNVRSSVPTNNYVASTGTAMASPHLAGVVALLWSAAPSLVGNIANTRVLLDNTAIDVESLACGGTIDDNNVFGEGRLNAFSAVDQAPRSPRGTLTGTITDTDTNAPLAGVTVRAVGPLDRTTTTDSSGVYSFILVVGNYDVTASKFSYLSETAMGVSVTEGGTTTQDFALTAQPVIETGPAPIVNESCPPSNSAVDPGERVTINLSLTNIGNVATTGLMATLQSGGGVNAPSVPQSYGVLSPTDPGSTATRDFSFTATGNCGDTITATWQLHDGTNNLGTVVKTYQLGEAVNGIQFVNQAPILIPSAGTSGPAAPYPSTIDVTGVGGAVTKVTATLINMNHTFTDDIDVLLVGPGGQRILLMSDAGGSDNLVNHSYTFDDAAATTLLDNALNASGTYKPSNHGTGDTFPAPAPVGPYPNPQLLSVFNGIDPNGTWSLYIVDDETGDTGNINLGWELNITTIVAACTTPCGTVRLVVTSTLSCVNPTTVKATYRIENTGTAAANNVTLTTAKLGLINGTPLPQTVGSIPAFGASSFLDVVFSPAPAPGSSMLTLGGTYTGGNFSSSKRVTVPSCGP